MEVEGVMVVVVKGCPQCSYFHHIHVNVEIQGICYRNNLWEIPVNVEIAIVDPVLVRCAHAESQPQP